MSMNGASWKLLVVIGPQATAVFGLVLERVLLGSREVVLRCIRKLGGKISHDSLPLGTTRSRPKVCPKVDGNGLVARSCPTLAIPWTAARQAPLSTGFPR